MLQPASKYNPDWIETAPCRRAFFLLSRCFLSIVATTAGGVVGRFWSHQGWLVCAAQSPPNVFPLVVFYLIMCAVYLFVTRDDVMNQAPHCPHDISLMNIIWFGMRRRIDAYPSSDQTISIRTEMRLKISYHSVMYISYAIMKSGLGSQRPVCYITSVLYVCL